MTQTNARQAQTVALVNLGENVSIDLTRLANRLNSLQRTWRFQEVAALPRLGEPDVESIWFYIDRLLQELAAHRQAAKFDSVIGLTHVRLENRDTVLGAADRDYFSLNDRQRLAVITEAMQQWNSPTRDRYQYFAFLIVGELLEIAAGTDLFHQSKEVCLFDDCADRAEFRPAIERGRICPPCCGALYEAHVAQNTVCDSIRILNWCRRNTVGKSLKLTLNSSLMSLVVGTAVGWATSAFIGPQWYQLVISVTLLVFLAVFLLNRYAPK